MINFPLPQEDLDYLNTHFPDQWKQLLKNSKKGIMISDYELPNGYNPSKSDLMLLIPENYPTTKIDMFYFSPSISREDGNIIEALSDENHFEKNWQRWSRHYEWRAGIDNIANHISYIGNELKNEFHKR